MTGEAQPTTSDPLMLLAEDALSPAEKTWLPEEDLDHIGGLRLARLLERRGALSEESVRAIEGLTVLRNLAAHGRAGDLTVDRALDYVVLAQGVLYAVDQDIRKRSRNGS